MEFEDILSRPPYSMDKEEKNRVFTERLLTLTEKHKSCCIEYCRMLDAVSYQKRNIKSYKDLPFLPVSIFKELELRSVKKDDVVKTMTSSGTSGQTVSKIYLDKTTSANQQKAMIKIVSDFAGSSRMPMIVIDCPSTIKNRQTFSARGAGILGFSIFATKKIYALNDDMRLNVEGLKAFAEKYKGQRILLFGFTFIVWQHFYKELVRLKENGVVFDFSNGMLIHGGGWKKLASEAVSSNDFKSKLRSICGIEKVYNYYGMAEQTGCIYMECECGYLHVSNFSDVIVRNPVDFSECAIGEKGIIQVVSVIPESYPGHSLLTEDEGLILGEDDCPCGRKGKYFKILGRLRDAEIRGCSDTYAAEFYSNKIDCSDVIQYIIGNEAILENMPRICTGEPFSQDRLDFLSKLSHVLLSDAEAKSFSDVISFAFWCRRTAMEEQKKRFAITEEELFRVGRGVVFHIAPSNIAVNYAYSFVAGFVTGNANIVRLPSKDFPQVDIINNAIKKVLEEFAMFCDYVCFIRYEKSKTVNDKLSALADVRVVWGGDNTINDLRHSQLKPRAFEITFADRYSVCFINADSYLALSPEEKEAVANGFYNDTYLTDQNACTSPSIVIWTTEESHKDEILALAKTEFWDALYEKVKIKYRFQDAQAVNKLVSLCKLAASGLVRSQLVDTSGKYDNRLIRIYVASLCETLSKYRSNSGYFLEYDMKGQYGNMSELFPLCSEKLQTLSYIGDSNIFIRFVKSGIRGIDRVVPVGKSMDFDFIWDGHNLVERMTRLVKIQQKFFRR